MKRSNALDKTCFPMEIFDLFFQALIIDSERSEYLPSLTACSLVCKPFVYLCRPHIFSHVRYGPYGTAYKTRQNLGKLLTKQPTLQKHVKNVTYVMEMVDDPVIIPANVIAQAKRKYGANAAVRPHIASFTNFSMTKELASYMNYSLYVDTGGRVDEFHTSLAFLLPNVESLKIEHIKCHTTNSPVSHTPCIDNYCQKFLYLVLEEFSTLESMKSISVKGFADARMWSVLDFPNLQHLSLECNLLDDWNCPSIRERADIDMPSLPSVLKLKTINVRAVDNFSFEMIKYCRDLEEIRISRLDYGSEVPTHLDRTSMVTSFTKLHTIFTDLIEEWTYFCITSDAIGAKAFPALRCLEIHIETSVDAHSANRVLDHCPQLERLICVTPSTEIEIDFRVLNIKECLQTHRSTLKHVSITCALMTYDDRDIPVHVLCEALSKVKRDNVIEDIEIKLRFHYYLPVIDGFVPMFEAWKRFDNVLKNRSKDFPCLRNVNVAIEFAPGIARPINYNRNVSWAGKEFLRGPLKRLYGATDIAFVCRITHE